MTAKEKSRQLVSRTKENANHINNYTQKSLGLDPGFGSSNLGFCITGLADGC